MKMKAIIPVSSNMPISALHASIGQRVPATWLDRQLGQAVVTSVYLDQGVPTLELEIDIKVPWHVERHDFSLADGEDEL